MVATSAARASWARDTCELLAAALQANQGSSPNEAADATCALGMSRVLWQLLQSFQPLCNTEAALGGATRLPPCRFSIVQAL